MTLGKNCSGCQLKAAGGTGWVIDDGLGDLGIAVIAEAPGEEEVPRGKPLVGKAGQTWDRIVSRTEHPLQPGRMLRRDDFWHSNILRCRPPDNHLTKAPYEFGAIAQCRPYLEEWLDAKRPRAIITLGNQPLRWFTGHWGIEQLQGYIWESKWGPVIGTYHPSYIMRGKWALVKMVQLAIRRAIEVADKGVPKLEKKYILYPSPMDVLRFVEQYEAELKRDPNLPLSFDIETPHSGVLKDEIIDPEDEEVSLEDDASYTIHRISFSFRAGEAITFPWVNPYPVFAARMLSSLGPKLGWNCQNFDIPRLEANGCTINGEVWDGMDMWHFAEPGLPMGLKYVATVFCPDMPAWKLESRSRPEWYSAADSDVALRCVSKIRSLLLDAGRWDTFYRHFIQLGIVLRRMSRRGVLVDRAQRVRDREDFERQRNSLREEILRVLPPELVPIEKVYTFDEERLRKQGMWTEGKMVRVQREEKEKPPKEKKPKVPRKKKEKEGSHDAS